MSGSSKQTPRNFDAKRYAKELSGTGKYMVNLARIDFQAGWAPIYKQFIETIKNYSVAISGAEDSMNFLDIEIDVDSTTTRKFKEVYAAILKAKDRSLMTCAFCGSTKHPAKERKHCQSCKHELVKINKTGTWLDNY